MLANILLVATLATTSLAVHIPRGATDGTYIAYINSTGHEVHELIATPTKTIQERNLNVFQPNWYLAPRVTGLPWKYPTAATWCGCGYNMDPQNAADATADLYAQVNGDGKRAEIAAGQSYYSIRGSVVSFMCNYIPASAGNPLSANPDWVSDGTAWLIERCGSTTAGTWEHIGGFGMVFGRMRMEENLDFCSNARKSSESECPLEQAKDELEGIRKPWVVEDQGN